MSFAHRTQKILAFQRKVLTTQVPDCGQSKGYVERTFQRETFLKYVADYQCPQEPLIRLRGRVKSSTGNWAGEGTRKLSTCTHLVDRSQVLGCNGKKSGVGTFTTSYPAPYPAPPPTMEPLAPRNPGERCTGSSTLKVTLGSFNECLALSYSNGTTEFFTYCSSGLCVLEDRDCFLDGTSRTQGVCDFYEAPETPVPTPQPTPVPTPAPSAIVTESDSRKILTVTKHFVFNIVLFPDLNAEINTYWFS